MSQDTDYMTEDEYDTVEMEVDDYKEVGLDNDK